MEARLVEICLEGMHSEYKVLLVNHHLSTFSRILECARNLGDSIKIPPKQTHNFGTWKPGNQNKRSSVSIVENQGKERGQKRSRDLANSPPPLPCKFAKAKAILAKWVEDGIIKLPAVEREPTKKETQSLKYCIYHRTGRHATKDCWDFRALLAEKIASGELELNKADQNVANNLLP